MWIEIAWDCLGKYYGICLDIYSYCELDLIFEFYEWIHLEITFCVSLIKTMMNYLAHCSCLRCN